MSGPCVTRPDLRSIHAAAQQAGFAGAVRGLPGADGYPPAEDDPPGSVARDAARVLAGAGFTGYHCDRYDLPCRPGGAGLTAIPAQSGTGRSAIAASRTTRDLLPDRDCRAACSHTCQLVNTVPGSVLHASGYPNRQPGIAGTRTVTSHRGQRTEAGR